MKIWVLFILALVLLFFSFREKFSVETGRPDGNDPTVISFITAYTGLDNTKEADKTKIQKYLTQIQRFYDTKYLPDKTTPTMIQITEFVASVNEPEINKTILSQMIDNAWRNPLFSGDGSDVGRGATAETGSAITTDETGTNGGGTNASEGGTGTSGGGTGTSGGGTGTSGGGTGTNGGGTGTSGGGTNASEGGTNGGGTGGRRPYIAAAGTDIWGPAFVGIGDSRSLDGSGSGSTRVYPTVWGGDGKSGEEGAGGTGGTGGMGGMGGGIGGLGISGGSLGVNANSGFFPTSRVPGDQDLITDPYRLRSQFSTSSYSSKTDPVPFLTDFSAFFK